MWLCMHGQWRRDWGGGVQGGLESLHFESSGGGAESPYIFADAVLTALSLSQESLKMA